MAPDPHIVAFTQIRPLSPQEELEETYMIFAKNEGGPPPRPSAWNSPGIQYGAVGGTLPLPLLRAFLKNSNEEK